jgi:tetratricopeptide (TPR) repeat protein
MQSSASRRVDGSSWCLLVATIVLGAASGRAAAVCDAPAGHLVAAEALVEVRPAGAAAWIRVVPPYRLCEGDQVAVRSPGRAAVVLVNDVLVRLDQETTLNVMRVAAEAESELGLAQGVVHVISRFRQRFGVTTPFVNALVEGTEFTVESGPVGARVVVAEGRVRTRNERGEQSLVAGEGIEAVAGSPPVAIPVRPLDAVRWAIHYPQIVWLDAAALAALSPAQRDAAAQAQREMAAARPAAALAILDGAAGDSPPLSLDALRVGVLLALGRVDAARARIERLAGRGDASIDALDAVIRVARNENDAALAAARRAIAADANAAAGHLALSYALQARREVAQALDAARDATRLAPDHPFAWARQAELELSLAQIDRGRASAGEALARAAALPRAQALLGFAQLLDGETTAALATFAAAIAADAADPLARFGSGLAHVRHGALADGRREIEIAVLLDPTNAELRSYLGRVYVEEDRSRVGGEQFALARRLDPASPTPWYFDAFRKLRDNDPLGAIGDSGRAIALNDNRAVFRSSELLDSDRAARSVSLGAAYREVGFEQPMRAAAMRALDDDPLSPAGHRLLAESYAETPRFETARVSELLQAQLRQPIGQLPIPPQFLSPKLPIVDAPRVLAPEEATALFDRKPWHVAASLVGGSQQTLGDSLIAARSTERAQVSLGHFDYRRDGLHDVADTDLTGTQLAAQFAPSPRTMLYGELAYNDRSGGDVTERLLAGVGTAWDQRLDHDVRTERARLSLRHQPSVNQEIIVTAGWQDARERTVDELFRLFPGNPVADASRVTFDVRTRLDSREFGVLYGSKGEKHGFVAGAGAYEENRDASIGGRQIFFRRGRILLSRPSFVPLARATNDHDNEFAYLDLRPARWATLYLGASHTNLDAGEADSVDRVNGKAGLTLNLSPATALRFAVFDGVKAPKYQQQTLEPTQFAGFNQIFDDLDGTRWRRSAVGFDHRFRNGIAGGLEGSRRALEVPRLGCLGECRADWREWLHRAYLAIPLGDRAALSIAWRTELLRLDDNPASLTTLPWRTRTELLPLGLWLKLGERLSTRVEAVRVRQEADIFDTLQRRNASRSEHFWLANARLSYTQPNRRVGASIAVHNVFDRHFTFQDTDLNGDPKAPLFYPSRTVLLQANVQF